MQRRIAISILIGTCSWFGCIKPEECTMIETAYGKVMPFLEYFVTHRVTGNVICQNGDRQSRGFEIFPIVPQCPSDSSSSDYHSVEVEINSACINYFQLQEQVSRWLITDIFGSAYVVKKDFSVSAECTAESTDIIIDSSIFGDLRRVFNDSSSYVELKLTNIVYSDKSFGDRKIVAVLEPVWNFIARTMTTPSVPGLLMLEIDVSGSEGKRLVVETTRRKSVTVDIHYTNSGHMIVELVPPESTGPAPRSSECDECIDSLPNVPRDCLDKSLSNACGAIVDAHCAAEWGKLKTACPACQVPF